MKLFSSLAALAAMFCGAMTAQAHVHVLGSVPADKSRVKAPAAIELHLSEAARLTALTLRKGEEAAAAIKPLPTKAAANISVPLPALAAGNYIASWRLVGDDGHVMSGTFAFTVDPAAPDAGQPRQH
jgi:methionine-rich copper-binding protein CopC